MFLFNFYKRANCNNTIWTVFRKTEKYPGWAWTCSFHMDGTGTVPMLIQKSYQYLLECPIFFVLLWSNKPFIRGISTLYSFDRVLIRIIRLIFVCNSTSSYGKTQIFPRLSKIRIKTLSKSLIVSYRVDLTKITDS